MMKTLTLAFEEESDYLMKTVDLLNQHSQDILKGIEQYKSLNLNLRDHNRQLDLKIKKLESALINTKQSLTLIDNKLEIIQQEYQISHNNKVLPS